MTGGKDTRQTSGTPAGTTRLRVGVSTCLLGENVRHDGGHKRNAWLVEVLGPHVEWVPVCPELDVGMGVPREALRLEGDPVSPRMVGTTSGKDWTEAMRAWADSRARSLRRLGIHGFVLMERSPSCGLSGVPVERGRGLPSGLGRGLFADTLQERVPQLPVEESGALAAPDVQAHFLDRMYGYRGWLEFLESGPAKEDLERFHALHRLTILAHNPTSYPHMSRLLTRLSVAPLAEVLHSYGGMLMEAYSHPKTVGQNTNVLQHVAGLVVESLPPLERAELNRAILDYREGRVQLPVPVSFLRRHLHVTPQGRDAMQQTYLDPSPAELILPGDL